MFEETLIKELKSDIELRALLSTYNNEPAIFSDEAPENATMPYIVFDIRTNSSEFSGVEEFTVMVDIFDHDKSRVNSRKAANRVKNWLDQKRIILDNRYDNIRFAFFSGSNVPGEDVRDIHYNLQFTARAGRKLWMEHNLN